MKKSDIYLTNYGYPETYVDIILNDTDETKDIESKVFCTRISKEFKCCISGLNSIKLARSKQCIRLSYKIE